MTIVIFDGNTLVADRRATTMEYKLKSSRMSSRTKLIVPTDYFWSENEPLLAMAFSGKLKTIDYFLYQLDFNKDNIYKKVRDIIDCQLESVQMSGIFVIESYCYHLRDNLITRHSNEKIRGKLRDKLVCGEPRPRIKYMETLLGEHNLFELVHLAAIGADSVGGGINYWSLDDRQIRFKANLTKEEREKVAKKVAANILKADLLKET